MRSGVVYHVNAGKPAFCFLRDSQDQQEYFAHLADFPDPKMMCVGQEVRFRPKLARKANARKPAATDVIAETALAAQ